MVGVYRITSDSRPISLSIPGKDEVEVGEPLRAGCLRIIHDRCLFCQHVLGAVFPERHGIEFERPVPAVKEVHGSIEYFREDRNVRGCGIDHRFSRVQALGTQCPAQERPGLVSGRCCRCFMVY